MKYAMIAAFAAGVSAGIYGGEGYGPAPNGTDSYVTKVLTAYTTVCPSPTKITHGGQTYTVSTSTTLTITNCPCTVTYPATTKSSTPAAPETPSSEAPKPTPEAPKPTPESPEAPKPTPEAPSSYSSPAAPVVPSPSGGAPYPSAGNGTAPTYSSPSATPAGPAATSTFSGAANQMIGQTGAGLAAIMGFAAYLL